MFLLSWSSFTPDLLAPAPRPRCPDETIFRFFFSGKIYGLVAPGYEMAEAVANTVVGEEQPFTGADMSTKLKLMGVDVASFGRYSGFKVNKKGRR